MPPKRSTRTSTPIANQSTLSFSTRSKASQAAANRVTKPSSTSLSKDKKSTLASKAEAELKSSSSSAPQTVTVEPEAAALPDASDDVDVLGVQQDEDYLADDPDALALREQESLARKISDKQIKSYWAGKEAMRKAPRVHQRQLSLEEKILREFDMSGEYGPSIGSDRSNRWKRAFHLGLKPPIEVLAVLVKNGEKSKRKGGADAAGLLGARKKREWVPERSIVEDLMASRVGTGLEV